MSGAVSPAAFGFYDPCGAGFRPVIPCGAGFRPVNSLFEGLGAFQAFRPDEPWISLAWRHVASATRAPEGPVPLNAYYGHNVVRQLPPTPGSANLFLMGAVTAGVWHMLRASSRRFDAAWFCPPVIISRSEAGSHPGGPVSWPGFRASAPLTPPSSNDAFRVAFLDRPHRSIRRGGGLVRERAPPLPALKNTLVY